MANTLGNPNLVENDLREDMVAVVNTKLLVGGGPNPILRIRRVAGGPTNLVDFPLNATTPLLAGTDDDGIFSFNFVASSAVASGGAATIPDAWQLLDKAGTVRLSGPITATDGITAGQTVNNAATTLTAPAT